MNVSSTFAAAVTRTLAEALVDDASVVVLAEGAGPVVDELGRRTPDQVLMLPIADRAAVAVAVGMAWGGRRVVVEISSISRIPALAEVLSEAGRSPADFPVPVVLRVPDGDVPSLDATALDLLAGIAGVTVLCPRDPGSAAGLIRAALASSGPTVILEPRSLARTSGPVLAGAASTDPVTVRPGRDVTAVGWGAALPALHDAAEALAAEGIEVQVVDLVRLAPVPAQDLGALLVDTGRLVVAATASELPYARRVLVSALGEPFLFLEAPPVACDVQHVADALRQAANY